MGTCLPSIPPNTILTCMPLCFLFLSVLIGQSLDVWMKLPKGYTAILGLLRMLGNSFQNHNLRRYVSSSTTKHAGSWVCLYPTCKSFLWPEKRSKYLKIQHGFLEGWLIQTESKRSQEGNTMERLEAKN